MQIDLAPHTTSAEVRQFLGATPPEVACAPSHKEAYAHLGRTLARFAYWKRSKAEKGLLRAYLQRTTGLSRAQTARLIKTYLAEGQLADGRKGPAQHFEVFGDARYECLVGISNGHLYNLRLSRTYERVLGAMAATRPTQC